MSIADMLSGVRGAVSTVYFHTATITRYAAGAADGYGQPTRGAASVVIASLPCYLTTLQPQNAGALGVTVGSDGLIEAGLYQFICDFGTDLRVNDTLTAVDDLGGAFQGGTAFRVDRLASNPVHVLALLRTFK